MTTKAKTEKELWTALEGLDDDSSISTCPRSSLTGADDARVDPVLLASADEFVRVDAKDHPRYVLLVNDDLGRLRSRRSCQPLESCPQLLLPFCPSSSSRTLQHLLDPLRRAP